MPYIVVKEGNKYKLCKRDEPTKCFSKRGMSLKKVISQLKAIGMNSHKKK